MMRWAWCWSDRREEKSLLERTRGSLSELWLVADWLMQLNPLSDTCVCVCEREREWVERQRKRERERAKEGERAPWKQLQQHKMEFVSALPKLCTFSIHLSDTADFPPYTFFCIKSSCILTSNSLNVKCLCCLHMCRILPQIWTIVSCC